MQFIEGIDLIYVQIVQIYVRAWLVRVYMHVHPMGIRVRASGAPPVFITDPAPRRHACHPSFGHRSLLNSNHACIKSLEAKQPDAICMHARVRALTFDYVHTYVWIEVGIRKQLLFVRGVHRRTQYIIPPSVDRVRPSLGDTHASAWLDWIDPSFRMVHQAYRHRCMAEW